MRPIRYRRFSQTWGWDPYTAKGGPGESFVRHILSQHANGFFGEDGELDATPLSREEHWMINDQASIERQNALAIATGSGPVRSRYRLGPEFDHLFPLAVISDAGGVTVHAPRPVRHLAITTVLSPRGATTIAVVETTR